MKITLGSDAKLNNETTSTFLQNTFQSDHHEGRSLIPRTCAEVIRFFGSCVSILVIRSLAEVDIEGHG